MIEQANIIAERDLPEFIAQFGDFRGDDGQVLGTALLESLAMWMNEHLEALDHGGPEALAAISMVNLLGSALDDVQAIASISSFAEQVQEYPALYRCLLADTRVSEAVKAVLELQDYIDHGPHLGLSKEHAAELLKQYQDTIDRGAPEANERAVARRNLMQSILRNWRKR